LGRWGLFIFRKPILISRSLDYNNDGHLDLVVATEESTVLLKGTGSCQFVNVSHLVNMRLATNIPAFVDLDNDGDLDLLSSRFGTDL
jgi:hypothetical protein